MALHPLAGKRAPQSMLIDVSEIVRAYFSNEPDMEDKSNRVAFGTSGHRGSSLKNSFNETHILAVTQAVCDYRKKRGIQGPLFLGKDTHALSEPCYMTSLEVLAANKVDVMVQKPSGYTPTPVISHAILTHNRRKKTQADGVVITPSHNPPEDGGFKYNPPEGGPADTHITAWIENRANELITLNNQGVLRIPFEKAAKAETTHEYDYISSYTEDLGSVIDIDVIRSAGIKIGVDPLGGSSLPFWESIVTTYALNIDIVNKAIDPAFGFMTLDKDGKIRMDCSSPYAMAGLIGLRDHYDIAFGNDPDADRHGIVTPSAGLMNPNAYLAVAIWYLYQNRPGWKPDAAVGKTLVSSAMIDRVTQSLGKKLVEVPVGFKWFVDGLRDGSLAFGGEESAGASFIRKDGSVWTTDKDGIIMNLLAAEMTARTGHDPAQLYQTLIEMFGQPIYERIDEAATAEQKSVLSNLSPDRISISTLAGDRILDILTEAPGNNVSIGGLKIISENGWFAARPSGTEDIYKIYTESFKDNEHLKKIQKEAREIIDSTFKAAHV